MGANYSFFVKTFETHARAFFKVIIFSIDSVSYTDLLSFDRVFGQEKLNVLPSKNKVADEKKF